MSSDFLFMLQGLEQYLSFDVDGTIWDSTPVVEKAWNAALRDSGHGDVSITADRLKGLFGLPMLDIIEDILPGSTLEEREAFLPLCSACIACRLNVPSAQGSQVRGKCKKKEPQPQLQFFGGRYRTRTCDPLHVKQVLYQLS